MSVFAFHLKVSGMLKSHHVPHSKVQDECGTGRDNICFLICAIWYNFPILNLIIIFRNVGKQKAFLCSLQAPLAKFQKQVSLILKQSRKYELGNHNFRKKNENANESQNLVCSDLRS